MKKIKMGYYGKTPLEFYNILKLIEILFGKES